MKPNPCHHWSSPESVLILAALLLVVPTIGSNCQAATSVGGGQSGKWTLAGSPYVVTEDVFVVGGQQLEIEPGVVVQFQGREDALVVDGTLRAVGTPASPIVFTSASTVKEPGQWESIYLRARDTNSVLKNCVIEFGGSQGFADQNVWVASGSPTIQNCVVRGCRRDGLLLLSSDARVEECEFSGNGGFAIAMRADSLPILAGNRAAANAGNSIGVFGSSFIRSGTWHRDNLPYTIVEDLFVASGQVLSLEAGVVVQFQGVEDALVVDGTLMANGTATSPVRFTSDDEVKAPGQWEAIVFRGPNTNSVLSNCIVEFGAANGFATELIRLENASPRFMDCLVQGSRLNGITLLNSDPRISNCTFNNNGSTNGGFAVALRADSLPKLNGNRGSGNGNDAIGVFGSSFTRSGIWNRDGLPYTVIEDLFISNGSVLTIEPGVVVQFQGLEDALIVDGTLMASGTRDLPIRFTSDDSRKEPGQWEAIVFRGPNTNSVLSNCIVESGAASGFAGESIRLENAAPLISDCVIRNSRLHGITLLNGDARIQNCGFTNNGATNGGFPIAMRADSLPKLKGNHGSGNGSDSIGVYGSSFTRSGSWNRDGLPFTIVEDLFVASGQVLSLEAGVVVQFQGIEDALIVDGTLLAMGTPESPVLFTSDKLTKRPGQWETIVFRGSATNSILSNCIVEYGAATGFSDESLRCENSSPTFSNVVVRESRLHGLTLLNSEARVEGCAFVRNGSTNGGFAILQRADAFPKLRNNSAKDNGHNSVGVFGSSISRSGLWRMDSIPYTLIEDLFIQAGHTLTIEPGTTVQFQGREDALIVDGILIARGLPGLPIRFTAEGTSQTGGQWESIYFRAPGAASVLEHCLVEFAGADAEGAVVCLGASPSLRNTVVRTSARDGITVSGGSPEILNCRISGNARDGLRAYNRAQPIIRDCSFLTNGGFGVANLDGGVVVLARENFWGDPSGPFDNSNVDGRNQLNPAGKGGAVSEFVDWGGFRGADLVEDFLVSVTPGSLDFGELRVGQSRELSLTIKNSGGVSALVQSAQFEGAGFTLGVPALPVSLAPGASTNLNLRFSPTSVGILTGRLMLTTVQGTNRGSASITLNGIGSPQGAAPVIDSIEPSSARPGTVVILRGAGFSLNADLLQVEVGGVRAEFLVSSANSLLAVIPVDVPVGNVDVVVRADGQASNPFRIFIGPATSTAPRLDARLEGASVVVSWPAPSPDYQLESAPELDVPVAWSPVNVAPNVANGRLLVSEQAAGASRYYRLSSTSPQGVIGRGAIPASTGGLVATPDGEATLEIPPGALEANAAIQVTKLLQPSLSTLPFAMNVVFSPPGLTFKQPAILSVRLPPGIDGAALEIYHASGLNQPRRSGAETNIVDLVTNHSFDPSTRTLRIPIAHFSVLTMFTRRFHSEFVFDIPGKYLKKGDLIYALTRDPTFGPGRNNLGWFPGHTGLYLGTTDPASDSNDGQTIVESTSADETADKRYGGYLDGVQIRQDFDAASSFFKFMGRGNNHLYMGARRPRPEPTDSERTAIATWALGKTNPRVSYSYVGGTGFSSGSGGLSCVGLTEGAYEAAGRNIVPGYREFPLLPVDQFSYTEPVTEVTIEVGDKFFMPVYAVIAPSFLGEYVTAAAPQYDMVMTQTAGTPADAVVRNGRAKFFSSQFFNFNPIEEDADLGYVFRFTLKSTASGEPIRTVAFLIHVKEKQGNAVFVRQDPPVIRIEPQSFSGDLVITNTGAHVSSNARLGLKWEEPPRELRSGQTYTMKLTPDPTTAGSLVGQSAGAPSSQRRLYGDVNIVPQQFADNFALIGYLETDKPCGQSRCFELMLQPVTRNITVGQDEFRIEVHLAAYGGLTFGGNGERRGSVVWTYKRQ